MINPVLAFALGSLTLTLAPGEGGATAAPRCVERAPNLVSVDDLNRMFARRALEVVRAAITSDRATLARLVSPRARFIVWDGDVGIGRREGVEGAFEFARRIGAAQFEYSTSYAGPLSTDPCGIQNAEILFLSATGNRAYRMQFRFERGMLVGVEGREGEVTRGNLNEGAQPDG